MSDILDLLVIGGGINGAGIARDATGRGLSVMLVEKGDLAEGTSSRSSKLIHGGLRYLEYYAFRLVREALSEREILLRNAPHIIWPLHFVLVHSPEQRPAWMISAGLFLYDHLGRRGRLPASRRVALAGTFPRPDFKTGFEYADCWVEDSRLVVLNALDAANRGATIRLHTELLAARREGALWRATLRNADGTTEEVRARGLVNAAGPWVEELIHKTLGGRTTARVKLVKGSHIVVAKFWDGDNAWLLQNDDKRVIFVIPYEHDFALIGTTDIPYEGRPEDVAIDPAERAYLLRAVNRYTTRPLAEADIVAEYAGVRPLYDDGRNDPSAVTRDYVIELDGAPPMLSIFGGKITTYRRLAEAALQRLIPYFPALGAPWTAHVALPGGDFPDADFPAFLAAFQAHYPWLPPALALHYARLYGTRAEALLGEARMLSDLGRHFGGLFYEEEATFLRRTEWARDASDILERRTRHFMHLSATERVAFAEYLAHQQ